MDLARVHGGDEAAAAQAQHVELRHAEPGAGEEPAEPGVLRGAGRGHAHPESGQVVHGSHGGRVRPGDEQYHGRRGREAEDDARRLAREAGAEAEHRLERRRRQIHLALGQRLGGAGLGARGAECDGEPLAREVAFRLGDPEREILG